MLKNILQQIYPLAKHNVIIADGLFPKNKYLKNLILTSNSIICCDGAINKLIKHNVEPHYIIGDCDNLNPIIQSKFANKIIKITEQNSNDLTKAINFAKKLKLDNIIILGATGLREDHTIANIALLADYIKL
ncbi:MAG TPA: thiamine diphosphokinase, partial [Burkholderiales bacterium]|nr:thiamine diphosphokinase [Burkholderiales bacterium]